LLQSLGFPELKIDDIQERFHTFGNFPFCKTLLNNSTITRLIDEELHLLNSLRINSGPIALPVFSFLIPFFTSLKVNG
jgi:hypothetical protein